MNEKSLSRSARELAAVLDEGGDVVERLREVIHRTMLWNYSTGRRKPDANSIAHLHRITDGRVAADGWLDAPSPETTDDGAAA